MQSFGDWFNFTCPWRYIGGEAFFILQLGSSFTDWGMKDSIPIIMMQNSTNINCSLILFHLLQDIFIATKTKI